MQLEERALLRGGSQSKDLENRLNTLKLRLQAGEIAVVQYADAASYLFHI